MRVAEGRHLSGLSNPSSNVVLVWASRQVGAADVKRAQASHSLAWPHHPTAGSCCASVI